MEVDDDQGDRLQGDRPEQSEVVPPEVPLDRMQTDVSMNTTASLTEEATSSTVPASSSTASPNVGAMWSPPIAYSDNVFDPIRAFLGREENERDVVKTRTGLVMTMDDFSNYAGDEFRSFFPISVQVQATSSTPPASSSTSTALPEARWTEQMLHSDTFLNSLRTLLGRLENDHDIVKTVMGVVMTMKYLKSNAAGELRNLFPISVQIQEYHCDVSWRSFRNPPEALPYGLWSCGLRLLPGTVEDSLVFQLARRNYEAYYQLPANSATVEQIANSLEGMQRWAEAPPPPPLTPPLVPPAPVPPSVPAVVVDSDLFYFYDEVYFEDLVDGMLVKFATIADALCGKVYDMRWHLHDHVVWPEPIAYGLGISCWDRIRTRLGRALQEDDVIRTQDGRIITPRQLRELEGDELKKLFPIYVRRKDQTVECVAVKKMPNARVDATRHGEPNEIDTFWRRSTHPPIQEDALTEIAILRKLQRARRVCPYILRCLGCFRDEGYTYLVSPRCDGDLFTLIDQSKAANEPHCLTTSMKLFFQLLQAVDHLHANNIGHRDISCENILVKGRRLQECILQLMDFGQAVVLRRRDGTRIRYFKTAGKDAYRPPEGYVPRRPLQIVCPAGAAGGVFPILNVQALGVGVVMVQYPHDAVADQVCVCQPVGYEVEPYDMFSVGVTLFILLFRMPPWRQAILMDSAFGFLHKNPTAPWIQRLAGLLNAWHLQHTDEILSLLAMMLEVNPQLRATIRHVLEAFARSQP